MEPDYCPPPSSYSTVLSYTTFPVHICSSYKNEWKLAYCTDGGWNKLNSDSGLSRSTVANTVYSIDDDARCMYRRILLTRH